MWLSRAKTNSNNASQKSRESSDGVALCLVLVMRAEGCNKLGNTCDGRPGGSTGWDKVSHLCWAPRSTGTRHPRQARAVTNGPNFHLFIYLLCGPRNTCCSAPPPINLYPVNTTPLNQHISPPKQRGQTKHKHVGEDQQISCEITGKHTSRGRL